jgi:hypothetical protein
VVDLFALNSITGALRFVGTNDAGSRYQIDLPSVELTPDTEFDWLSEDYAQLTVTGIATRATGSFGTATELSDEATA